MNKRIIRTVLLMAVAAVLYGVTVIYAGKISGKWLDFLLGASAGLALAATVSFILLIVAYFKER